MKIFLVFALSSREFVCPVSWKFDSEYTDDVIHLSKNPRKLQMFLGSFNEFRVGFEPLRYKTLTVLNRCRAKLCFCERYVGGGR